jgi:predicted amidohydrolase
MGTLTTLGISAALGLAGGLLCVLTWRARLAAWVALMPLAATAWLAAPLAAAVAGLLFGATAAAPMLWGRVPFNRRFERITIAANAVSSGAVMALAAWAWPNGTPAWGLAVFPAAMLLMTGMPERQAGRLANGVLALAQRNPTLVYVARLGHDQAVTALLALWSVLPVVLFANWPPTPVTIALVSAGFVTIAAALAFGRSSLARARRMADAAPTIRVAAVAADLDTPGPPGQEARGRLAEVIGAYDPLLMSAFEQRARLVVLPENAAWASTDDDRTAWLGTLARWARRGQATVVAGMFDETAGRNQVVIVGPDGWLLASYDKRHPFGAGERLRSGTGPPAIITEPVRLSAAICYDLDYNDLVRPVRRHGGILAAPVNDWAEYAVIHRLAAVWVPVCTGTTLVRAASHGISAIIDPAGRTLAEASSFDGPVTLVADAPMALRRDRATAAERPTGSRVPSVPA